MRRFLSVLLVTLVAAGVAQAASLEDAVVALPLTPLWGTPPPPLALERLADGKQVGLAELKGRPVLVYFWATW